MKLCRTCRFGSEYELDKPCIVYREDCPLYQKVGEEMTNKEAIEELKAIKSEYNNKAFGDSRLMRSEIEALDLAIKALESIPNYKDAYNKGWDDGAKATYEHLKMCEEEQEPCNDAISRQAVLDGIEELKKSPWATDKRGNGFEYLIAEALDVVADLCVKQASSVNPQEPKTGHWIYDRTRDWDGECKYECSECGMGSDVDYSYCMRCGAKMIEPQEKEG